jgi:hypothetical protein
VVLILAALVAWLLPVGAGWIAWHMARTSYFLLRHGGRTTGTITAKGTNIAYVRYCVGEATYETTTSWWYLGRAPVGAAVPVVYPPDAPDQGCVNHWTDLWIPPFLWLCVAVFFLVLDIWY